MIANVTSEERDAHVLGAFRGKRGFVPPRFNNVVSDAHARLHALQKASHRRCARCRILQAMQQWAIRCLQFHCRDAQGHADLFTRQHLNLVVLDSI